MARETITVTISGDANEIIDVSAPTSGWVVAILAVLTEDQRRRVYERVEARRYDVHPEMIQTSPLDAVQGMSTDWPSRISKLMLPRHSYAEQVAHLEIQEDP